LNEFTLSSNIEQILFFHLASTLHIAVKELISFSRYPQRFAECFTKSFMCRLQNKIQLTIMTNLERILKIAQSDQRLQNMININAAKAGCTWHLVGGYAFEEQSGDSPAFCLGVQILNHPVGAIFVGKRFSGILTDGELEFVTLHELGHIMKNHFIQSSLIWLAKSWIIERIAEGLEVSRRKAIEYLDYAKLIVMIFSGKKTIEEAAKANVELEADQYAVTIQGQKQHAISTLLKMANGAMTAPTHVTSDGTFPFPIVTYQERIEAINRI
jgi:Zn-dependent protease with chaperone function